MKRKGLGKGLGQGYKNIAPMDSYVHSMSAQGIKTLEIDRATYGKLNPKLAKDLREYRLKGTMFPVGTIKEWKSFAKERGIKKLQVSDVDGNFDVTVDAKGKRWSQLAQKRKVLTEKQANKMFKGNELSDLYKGFSIKKGDKWYSMKLEPEPEPDYREMEGEREAVARETMPRGYPRHLDAKKVVAIKDMRYNNYEIFDAETEKLLFIVDKETLNKNVKSGFWVLDAKGWKKQKGTWEGEDAWQTVDGKKRIEISWVQDRDGKNAFLYTAREYPYRLALNPRWAKKSRVIAQGRDYDKVKSKVKEYVKVNAKGRYMTNPQGENMYIFDWGSDGWNSEWAKSKKEALKKANKNFSNVRNLRKVTYQEYDKQIMRDN